MSIIFPLFGTGTPQGIATDGYFLEGTDLKRIKSESFEIDTLFSNVDDFFVDRKENLYVSQYLSGSIKKYVKNFRTGNFDFLAWTISGEFDGGSVVDNSSFDIFTIESYPFISDFQNVAVDSQFNFYFRDTTDSNKLKKYSVGGQLIASTSSDIGEFAVNKDNIISFSGSTVTKRDLSGNFISSFTVTGDVVAVNSDRVFSFDDDDESFSITYNNLGQILFFGKIYSYSLSDGSLVWSVDRIFTEITNNVFGFYDFIPLKNGSILMRSYGQKDNYSNSFYGYILINSNGNVRHSTPKLRTTGTISGNFNDEPTFGVLNINTDPTSLNQYLYTQGANSDRSRLNF